jgi:hypothetical protein
MCDFIYNRALEPQKPGSISRGEKKEQKHSDGVEKSRTVYVIRRLDRYSAYADIQRYQRKDELNALLYFPSVSRGIKRNGNRFNV